MDELEVISYKDGALVVDSRLIAQELGIEHKNFMESIKKYQTNAEQAFGILRFQTEEIRGRGQPERFVYLTQDQATFYMTLSRNTPEVVVCKVKLVSQFSKAKRLLREQGYSQIPHSSIYILRLENIRDHIIDDDKWSTFRESSEILLEVERDLRVPVQQMDLCDGSIGIHWGKFRKGKEWAVDSGFYTHVFRDHRGDRQCNAYNLSELPNFRKWLREFYRSKHLPKYLKDKYGKRAVRQIYTECGLLNDYVIGLTEEKRSSKTQDDLYRIFIAAREAFESRKSFE